VYFYNFLPLKVRPGRGLRVFVSILNNLRSGSKEKLAGLRVFF